jgi:hypothetical protein
MMPTFYLVSGNLEDLRMRIDYQNEFKNAENQVKSRRLSLDNSYYLCRIILCCVTNLIIKFEIKYN